MKKLIKVLNTVLVLFLVIVFIGCSSKTEYSLDVEVTSEIYVNETANYSVKVMPNNEITEDHVYASSDEAVLEVNQSTIKGLKEGSCDLIITLDYDGQKLEKKITITVIKEEINYELEVQYNNKLTVGSSTKLEVKEKVTNQVITDFQVFSNDETIAKYEENELKALKIGSVKITVTTIIDEKTIKSEFTFEVIKEEINYELEVQYDNKLTVGSSTKLEVKEKVTNQVITDFQVFLSDETIANYEDSKIKGLKAGSVIVTVSTVIEEETIKEEFTLEIIEDIYLTTNIPSNLYAGQLIEVEVKVMPDDVVIDDFELISSNTNFFEYYSDDYEGETYEEGKVILTITANYNNISLKLEIEINILESLSLKVDFPDEITALSEIPFKLYIMPGEIEVSEYKISSSDTKIIEVEVGKLKALASGKSKISMSCTYDGAFVSLSKDVKVNEYIPDSLESNIVDDFLFIDESLKLNVFVAPKGTVPTDLQVISSQPTIIDYVNGELVAKACGTSIITIKSGTLEKEYELDVVEFGSIKVEVGEEISQNEVIEYKVTALPSNKVISNFSYSSSNLNAILINGNVLYGTGTGISTITVEYTYKNQTYNDSKSITSKEIVYPIERIYLTGANGILVGGQTELTTNIYPSNGAGNILYVSSDATIVSVDTNGVVTGLKEGKCYIEASLEGNSNIKNRFEITVLSLKAVSETTGATYNEQPFNARYYEESIKNYNELMNGVVQITYNGFTSTQLSGDVDGYSGITGDIVADQYYEQQVNLLMVPSSTDTLVVPWANLGNNKWSLTTVKGLIENYELKNPGYKVIAAVNGDFFDINANGNLPYQTTGENITNGEFYKTTNSFGDDGGTIGFTNDGSNLSLVASANATRTEYMILAIYDDNGNIIKEFDVQKLNEQPGTNETSVYFGTYNSDKQYVGINSLTDNTWIVENAELALPNNATDFYGLGSITSTTSKELQIGEFAISSNNSEVINALAVGKRIRVQYEYSGEFANIKSSTGYNCMVYDDLNNINFTNGNLLNRAPRTVIGMKEDGTLVMMVIDGRQGNDGMYGADGYELTAIMKAYGCVKAYNVDGGGSSTIVIRTEAGLEVLNSPSDGRERSDGNCILIVAVDPNYQTSTTNITDDSATISVSTETTEYKDYNTFIKMDNEYYPVQDGKVELTGLVHNNTYSYRVYYQKDGELYPTQTVSSFTTNKANFKYLGLTISETDTTFVFNSYSDDIDNAGNIKEMTVIINGLEAYLKDNTLTVKKSVFGEIIETLSISYWYMEDNERKTVTNNDPVYYFYK